MVEVITKVIEPILVIVIAGVVTYIAWQQWQTNRLRLKNELFDRRMKYYEAARDFLVSVGVNARVKEEEFKKFLIQIRSSRFLFGKEIEAYFDTVRKVATDTLVAHAEFQNLPQGVERSKLVKNHSANVQWLVDQHEPLAEKFDQYLKIPK